jgi:hypothetical protein
MERPPRLSGPGGSRPLKNTQTHDTQRDLDRQSSTRVERLLPYLSRDAHYEEHCFPAVA